MLARDFIGYYHTSMDGKSHVEMLDGAGTADRVATAFARARMARICLGAFPGEVPVDSAAAYAVQMAQMARRGERVVGWKVAMVANPFRQAFGDERLSGPVFESRFVDRRNTMPNTVCDVSDWAVIRGGFAAVEAEFIAVMACDSPVFGRKPTPEEAADLISSLHVGMELAGSPLATINNIGPFATTADCGNNDGVVIGPAIQNWRTRAIEDLTASISVNGVIEGVGSAASIKGGPLEAVAFLVDHLERRGLRLKAGDIVSTGAATGIHKVLPGDAVLADFGPDGQLKMRAV